MRTHPFGASYLDWSDMHELREVFDSRILFRWLAPDGGASVKLEDHIKRRFAVNHALAVPNCTQALRLSLIATQPRVGDLVYLSAVSFVASAGAILTAGLIPILVDVDRDLKIDLSQLPSDAERVVIPHMEGFVNPLPVGVPFVVEDCAQALGAQHADGRYVGTAGYAGVYSFNHNKMLSAGEGGVVVTNDDNRAVIMRSYHDHGSSRVQGQYPTWREGAFYGENLVTNELTSAVQLQQFRHLNEVAAGLERHYTYSLNHLPSRSDMRLIERKSGDLKWSVAFELESPELRQRLLKKLTDAGFTCWTMDRYFLPDHPVVRDRQSIYADGFPWNLQGQPLPSCSADSFASTRERLQRVLCVRLAPEWQDEQHTKSAEALGALLTAA